MWHRQGRVSLTKGSDVVTGVGTNWVENIRVGDAFQGPDGKLYQVINVASNEALAISPAYEGNTATNLNYWIVPIPGYSKTQADRLSLIISKLDGDIVTATEAADRAQAAAQQAQQWRNEATASAAAALQSEQSAALSADIAEQARDDAVAVVTGGTASIDPEAGKIPIAGAEASIKQSWIENLQFELDALRVARNKSMYGDGPYPVLDFQFQGAKYLDPRIQFTRASLDWDEEGNEYGLNEPVLTEKGLWASGERANLLIRSKDFSGWLRYGRPSTLTLGYVASPIGLGSAALWVGGQDESGSVYISRGPNSTSYEEGKSYVASFFVKFQPQQDVGSRIEVRLHSAAFGSNAAAVFYYDGTVAVTGSAIRGGAEPVGGGFVRLWVSATATQAVTTWSPLLYYYSENLSDGIVVSNPDFKEGVSLTPYIPTEGSQVTVATGTLNSIRTSKVRTFTWEVEMLRSVTDSNTVYFLSWGENETGNIPRNGVFLWSQRADQLQARVYVEGSLQSVALPIHWEDARKIAFSIREQSVGVSVNGLYAEIATDSDMVEHALHANICPSTLSQSGIRWIKSAILFNQEMTEQQLQELTAL